MSSAIRLLAFAGSTRRGSFNKKLVRIAAAGARDAGAEVTEIDLAELQMPLYDQDLETEHGMPENAATFKQLMIDHDGFIISSPEYNSSLSGVLKNAIDWASRRADDDRPLRAYAGKTAVVMATSPGRLGGLRGLGHLRSILSNLQVLVLPEQQAVPHAAKAFDEEGNLSDANSQEAIRALGRRLVEVTKRLRSD